MQDTWLKNSDQKSALCESEEGNILTKDKDVLEKWQEYFEELLNKVIIRRRHLIVQRMTQSQEVLSDYQYVDFAPDDPQSYQRLIIRSKNNKAVD